MKILMVLDREFPPDIRVENEIEALSKAGHDVHIACYTQKNKPALEKSKWATIYRKPISVFHYKSSIASLTLPFYFRFWKRFLHDILQSGSFDAIHVHDLPLVGVCVRLKEQFNLKLVADLHENWPAFIKISRHTNTLIGKILSPVFLWRSYEKKVLRSADSVIVVVEEARDRLINLGIAPAIIHIVSNTIHLDRVQLPEHQPGQDIILYYAGGINHHRGLQDIIYAMSKTSNTKIKFWILGEGNFKEELMLMVKRYDLQQQVIFHGYKSFQVVMEMLAQADFAVIPHLKTEHTDSTIPHKLFQYMYAGKPVIASDCLPIKRILEKTGAGLVYPSQDTEKLIQILDHLDNLNYKDMSAKGKKGVTDIFNWGNDSRVLVQLYQAFTDNGS